MTFKVIGARSMFYTLSDKVRADAYGHIQELTTHGIRNFMFESEIRPVPADGLVVFSCPDGALARRTSRGVFGISRTRCGRLKLTRLWEGLCGCCETGSPVICPLLSRLQSSFVRAEEKGREHPG